MAISPQQRQEAYKMLNLLGVKDSGVFEVDVKAGLSKLSTILDAQSSDNKFKFSSDSEYSASTGQSLLNSVPELKETLNEALENKSGILGNVVSYATSGQSITKNLEAAFKDMSFPAGVDTTEARAKHFLKLLDTVPAVISTFDEAAKAGWDGPAEKAPETKPKSPAESAQVKPQKIQLEEPKPQKIDLSSKQPAQKKSVEVLEGSVEAASIAVEIALQDMVAPLMKANGVELKFDGAPDGTFGVDSQKALQSFLIGVDAQIGDLGETPWLYDETVSGKLSTHLKSYIKSDPLMLAEEVNKLAGKSIVGVKDGALVWALDDPANNPPKFTKGEALNEEALKDVHGGVDKKVDELLIHLNTLKEKDKLSTEQLVSMGDLMPPQMKFFGFIIGMIAPYLPQGWMEGISAFVENMFGFDLMSVVPQDEETQKYAIGDTFGVTDDIKQNVDKLAELYKDALKSADGNPETLRKLVKDGVKAMYGKDKAPAQEQKLLDAVDKAVDAAQNAVAEDGNPSPELSALKFSSVYYNNTMDVAAEIKLGKDKAEAREESMASIKEPVIAGNGDVIFYSDLEKFDQHMGALDNAVTYAGDNRMQVMKDQTARFNEQIDALNKQDMASRDGSHDSQKELQAHGAPQISIDEKGNVMAFYVDRAVSNHIKTAQSDAEALTQARRNMNNDKNFSNPIAAYDRRISDLKEELKSEDVYASEKEKIAERIEQLEAESVGPAAKFQRVERDLAQATLKYKTFNRTQYKTVDITKEMEKARDWLNDKEQAAQLNNSATMRKEFPGLHKMLSDGKYTLWNDVAQKLGDIDKTISRQKPYSAKEKSALVKTWKQANKVDQRLEGLEKKSDALAKEYKDMKARGVSPDSDEFQDLRKDIEKFARQKDKIIGRIDVAGTLEGNKYLKADDKRAQFKESKGEVFEVGMEKHLHVPGVRVLDNPLSTQR